jgi:hypothetical protein
VHCGSLGLGLHGVDAGRPQYLGLEVSMKVSNIDMGPKSVSTSFTENRENRSKTSSNSNFKFWGFFSKIGQKL